MNFRYGNMPYTLLEYDLELKRERDLSYILSLLYTLMGKTAYAFLMRRRVFRRTISEKGLHHRLLLAKKSIRLPLATFVGMLIFRLVP